MSHTPGPWYAIGSVVFKDVKDRRFEIADTRDWSGETEANAALITAAPEMLEALKLAQNLLDRIAIMPTDIVILASIEHAIAKAQGVKE